MLTLIEGEIRQLRMDLEVKDIALADATEFREQGMQSQFSYLIIAFKQTLSTYSTGV